MLPLSFGALGSPPSLLIGLLALAVVLLVGRLLLSLAWRLVLIAAAVVCVLWILGAVGLADVLVAVPA